MSEIEREVYRAYTTAQDRYGYFMIAAAGAAIAFAVARTDSAAWTGTMWLWVTAIACWATSFFAGIKYMRWLATGLRTNHGLLVVQSSRDPMVGSNPMMKAVASEVIREAVDKGSRWSGFWSTVQLYLLIAGALTYIFWHIWEMVERMP